MNIVAYFQGLFSAGTIGAYISLSVWSVLALAVILGICFGLKRGLYRSTVRLLYVALAAVCAYFAAASVGGIIYKNTEGMTLIEIFDAVSAFLAKYSLDISGVLSEDLRGLIGSFDAELASLLVSLISALLLAPLAFSIAFSLLRLVSWVLYWLTCAILGLSKRRVKMLSRSLGMLVGIVEGCVVAAAVLLPIAGFATVAEEIKPTLTAQTQSAETREAAEGFYRDYVDELTANPLITAINKCGGTIIFDNITAMTTKDGKAGSATEEVDTVSAIYRETLALADFDWKAPTPEAKAALENVLDIVKSDGYAASLVAGVMRGLDNAIENDALVIVAEEPMASLIDSIFNVFSDSSKDTVAGDLKTILHVYFILGDYNVLNAFDDTSLLRDAMLTKHENGKTVIDSIVDELYLNPRTAHIVGDLTEISIKVMCDMVLTEEAAEIYENVKLGVNEVLALNAEDFETHEEYVGAVSETLDEKLKENNIELDEATLNNMSEYIADNYSDVNEITDDDINKAILYYYNAYADAQSLPEIPESPDIPERSE